MPQIQYFLGANSPSGFYSLYHGLLSEESAEGLYVLKGGPGCGKSSFLRRVARHAEAAGEETVLIPCSADPDSLDAVLIPRRGIALADGTAPHVMEPSYPGVVGHYVNLGDCYDREGLRSCRTEILEAFATYQGQYKGVYRCLEAASQLHRDNRELLLTPDLLQKLRKRAEGIIRREIKKTGGGGGTVTYRFLSAVTHRGRVFLKDSVTAQAKKVYELADRYGLAHEFLSPILRAAAAAGWDVTACPDPMAPDRLAHLILPGLSLAFVSTAEEPVTEGRPYRRLRLDAMTDRDTWQACRPRLRFSRKVAAALEEEAAAGLSRAKAAHDRLEALYNPHVDFQRVYRMADDLAAMLFPSA